MLCWCPTPVPECPPDAFAHKHHPGEMPEQRFRSEDETLLLADAAPSGWQR
jgi:hypothetical protein